MSTAVNIFGIWAPTHNLKLVSIPALLERNEWIFAIDELFERKTNHYLKLGKTGLEAELNVMKSQVKEKIKIKQ